MMRVDEQIQAIETIDRNLAVNAGAGTGKTKVLTERYVYILENGDLEKNKEVESIVAITFTKKATQEMKERIRKAIRERFHEDKKWQRFYNDMEKANISTIHSFCGNILRDNALKANIDPMFTILDEEEGDRLLKDTIRDVLVRELENNKDLFNMMLIFGIERIDRLTYEIRNIYYKVRNSGYSFEDVRKRTLEYLNGITLTKDDLSRILEGIKEKFLFLMENTRKNSKFNKLKTHMEWVKFHEGTYSQMELYSILEHLYDNIGSDKKQKDSIEALKAYLEDAFRIREKEFTWCYELFINLLEEVDREYSRRKDEMGALDYEDLQILVLELLEDDSVRKEYQNKYRYIMIDEFQDTNELQKRIFYKLCSSESLLDRNNLFIVGDPKQSIYGFRGADLDVFYEVVKDIERISGNNAIDLSLNFRSVNTIIDFVNNIFSSLMGERYTPLKDYYKSPNNIDVEIIKKDNLEIPESYTKSEYEYYVESRLIAGRIKELVEEGTFEYKDFCLLFRSGTQDYIYEDALREFNIPYYNVSGKGFFETQEIKDLINALKAISNRYDTIPAIGFLRSPMIGLSDRTIYWLLRNKDESVYDTLKKDIQYIDEDERVKVRKALEILDEFMLKKDLYGVSRILKELIDRTFYKEVLQFNPLGRQMILNVEKLMDICREFDRTSTNSLEDFLDYIEEIKNSGESNESKAKIYSEDANVVKLMTIHKSKGLQFPVVIIPQMSKGKPNDRNIAVFHKDLGLGLRIGRISPFVRSIKDDIALREEEEDKRILYVAMTRAEKRLILGCLGNNRGFKKMISDLLDMNQVTYIDKDYEKPEVANHMRRIDKKLFASRRFDYSRFPLIRYVQGFNTRTFQSFSVSQFMDFIQCRRRYFLKYYGRLPLDDVKEYKVSKTGSYSVDGILKGNIIHRFCQHYSKGQDAKELLRQVVNSYGIPYTEELEKELYRYVENYLDLYVEDYEEFYTEREFFLKIGDTYIRGIIDRINIRDGKCQILDFKTNKIIDLNSLRLKYEPQIKLYANAVRKITGMEINKAQIIFLDTKDVVDIDVSEDSLNKNMESIVEFIDFVNNNSKIEQYEKSKSCTSGCEYSVFCKYD